MNEPIENVTVIPDETNTQKWLVELGGPVSSRILWHRRKS
jgi:hypothetical protein